LTAEELSLHLGGKPWNNGFMAPCPAHDDSRPSLKISQAGDKILLWCWAGCRTEDVLKAAGLQWGDLFDGNYDPEQAFWMKVRRKADQEDALDNFEAGLE